MRSIIKYFKSEWSWLFASSIKIFLSHFFYYENSRLHLQYIHVASVDRIKVNNETEKEVKGERMEEL